MSKLPNIFCDYCKSVPKRFNSTSGIISNFCSGDCTDKNKINKIKQKKKLALSSRCSNCELNYCFVDSYGAIDSFCSTTCRDQYKLHSDMVSMQLMR